MRKDALTNHDIHQLLKQRWSPRAISAEPVDQKKILNILEAARWAPSSANQQPWRFIIGINGDETYQKIFNTLVEFNQAWAKVPILILSIGKTKLNMKDAPNESYSYDVGQAVANLTIQASSEGLFVHQMGGFDKEKAIELFNIPSAYKPLTVIAIGYYGNADLLPENLKIREYAQRERSNLEEIVFSDSFGHKADIFNHK